LPPPPRPRVPSAPQSAALRAHSASQRLLGTVLRARSGFYSVRTAQGIIECQLRGRVKRDRSSSDLAVIGDVVELVSPGDGTGTIERIEERRSRFGRRQPGPRGTWREDVLVANLDQVLVVFACAEPEPHLRMVDRFLVIAAHSEIDAVLVVNKIDRCGEPRARDLFGIYEQIGYPVEYVSARTGHGLEALRGRLDGRISVVAGPSGVGKSTLLNVVQPGLKLATGEVSDALGKGRHTTSAAELLPLDGRLGGWVADTPGLREIGLWSIPDDELAWCFPEMRPLIGGCGFNDCRHIHEPRCAIRAALEAGAIEPARYESYARLVLGES
jgi:ribosome biogenesis GTPase / thiamine phosphate phosphatase